MGEKTNIMAIILAGGKSLRMGTDKGLLQWKGKSFVEHLLQAVGSFAQNTVIVSNNPMYDAFGVTRLEDDIPDSGPLAGLYTGLHFSSSMWSMVLSCDVPLVNPPLLNRLVKRVNTSKKDIILFRCDGRLVPLVALYKKSCEEACRALLQKGQRRLMALIENSTVEEVLLKPSEKQYVANINTFEDLNRLMHEYHN